jgi:hypothetical protein
VVGAACVGRAESLLVLGAHGVVATSLDAVHPLFVMAKSERNNCPEGAGYTVFNYEIREQCQAGIVAAATSCRNPDLGLASWAPVQPTLLPSNLTLHTVVFRPTVHQSGTVTRLCKRDGVRGEAAPIKTM